jgi:DNA-binding XRE family transcriptional regulator
MTRAYVCNANVLRRAREVGVIDIGHDTSDCEAVHEDEIAALYLDFGARVKEARGQSGLSQATVAQHLNLSRTSVTNIEAGRQRLLLHQAVALAELFEVPIAELVPAPPPQATSAFEVKAAHADLATMFTDAARTGAN